MIRRFCLALSVFTIAALPLTERAAFAAENASPKQRYAMAEDLRLGRSGAVDRAAAFEVMQALALEGEARAQAKLAYYHLKGIGTEVDPEASALWYRRAIDGGRYGARTSYAKLLMSQGQVLASLEQLDIASEAGDARAQAQRAAYHYQGKFGAASDPDFGKEELSRFAQDGHLQSMKIVLLAEQRGADFAVDTDVLRAQMIAVAQGAEPRAAGKAAEALLKIMKEDRSPEGIALRKDLVAHEGVRARVRSEAALYLAHDTQDALSFRGTAAEIVAQTPADGFARSLVVVARLDKNAFVHVLQAELNARGYRSGPQTGVFNTRTLQAVTYFCRDRDIQDMCRLGPLRSKVIKTIAAELAEMASV